MASRIAWRRSATVGVCLRPASTEARLVTGTYPSGDDCCWVAGTTLAGGAATAAALAWPQPVGAPAHGSGMGGWGRGWGCAVSALGSEMPPALSTTRIAARGLPPTGADGVLQGFAVSSVGG